MSTFEVRTGRVWPLLAGFAGAVIYLVLVTCQFAAWELHDRPDYTNLRLATRLAPGNSEYRYTFGRYLMIARDLEQSAAQFRSAIALNPYDPAYHLGLAQVYELLGLAEEQGRALDAAVHAAPTDPTVAWEAANFYLARGENRKSLDEFRVVLRSDPSTSLLALQRSWRALPDADQLLRNVVPASTTAYLAFLDLMMQRRETNAAAKVWNALVNLNHPVEPRYVFDYVRFAAQQGQPEQARIAWLQAAKLMRWSEYLPEPNNLIVNGDFSLNILNGGFDWNYQRQPSVSLVLDPSEYRSGHNSLAISFDGPGVHDAGVYQWISVTPNTSYDFTGYFKTDDLEGAGGPVFTVRDFHTGQSLYQSDNLKDADIWKPVHGRILTTPETRLVVLSIDRIPSGSPIRGRIWIDDLQLTQTQP
jgi:tetratricopeptide (TPR) repeat protein